MPNPTRLNEAIAEYTESRKAVGIKAWRSEEQTLLSFMKVTGNLLTKSIDARHVDRWMIEHPDWAPSSRAKQVARLSTFQTWCWGRRYMTRGEDILQGYRRLKVPKKERPRIPLDQFGEFLDRAINPRDRMVVALGLFTVVRVSEMIQVQWRDVLDLENEDERRLSIYREKTGDWDKLPIGPDLHDEIVRYRLALCKALGVAAPQPDWWVVCALQRPQTRNERGVYVKAEGPDRFLPHIQLKNPRPRIQEIMRQAGLYEKGVGMHALRRSGARAYFEDLRRDEVGKDEALTITQSMLGHASVKQTQHYIGFESSRELRDKVIRRRRMLPSSTVGDVVELRSRGNG